ncbi:MAG TPA: nucleotide sugar dehydrogenase [Flavilitoribacter sp.]|nr:nucleotide sugar dehydrogenase [Flavilitoribacter sp.]HMQ88966.1 nucleotide sugar dehydrogenase [Flavilitoribacter sp.]
MFKELEKKEKAISVIGLGYVGLPLALAFARKFKVIGFDINEQRVAMMRNGEDPSKELESDAFEGCDITFTSNLEDLKKAHFHVVAVPTPVDEHNVPDLKPVLKASESVGKALKKGDYVVYESTVYPGCTEEDCQPILENLSGLKLGDGFKLGYSPERINPGDKEHTIEKILKIVSGSDAEALEEVAQVYGAVIHAGIYKASCIKVAEAAKVIENTQRDLNIAFMNELSIIFDRLGIDTKEVLDAAGTKWNFLRFTPGLVGGHCIGVDPYYLLHKANELDYNAQVITSGRRINDEMPAYIAKRLVQLLIQNGKNPGSSKVLVMGVTFKENVADIRNSKVVDLIRELMQFSVNVHITDPYASPNEVAHEYKLSLVDAVSNDYDAVLVAVGHEQYKKLDFAYFRSITGGDKPILMDIKAMYAKPENNGWVYWRL